MTEKRVAPNKTCLTKRVQNPSGFLIGDSLTYADLMLASINEIIYTICHKRDQLYEGFPEIKEHYDKVRGFDELCDRDTVVFTAFATFERFER